MILKPPQHVQKVFFNVSFNTAILEYIGFIANNFSAKSTLQPNSTLSSFRKVTINNEMMLSKIKPDSPCLD